MMEISELHKINNILQEYFTDNPLETDEFDVDLYFDIIREYLTRIPKMVECLDAQQDSLDKLTGIGERYITRRIADSLMFSAIQKYLKAHEVINEEAFNEFLNYDYSDEIKKVLDSME